MKRSACLSLCKRVVAALFLLCLLANGGGWNAAAQAGGPVTLDGTPPPLYVPLVQRACPAIQPKAVQCVDCAKYYYNMTPGSLRLDGNDYPHIAYGGDHLYHAWNDGQTWHYETVDSSPGVGVYASLALDSTGKPAITYYDRYNQYLKIARWNGASWGLSVVDAAPYAGLGSEVLFDSTDHLLVAYLFYETNGSYTLKLTRWTGSAWSAFPNVDTDTGKYFSLALDKATGWPRLSYNSDPGLMYASWNGSAWDRQLVVDDSSAGEYNSLALDKAGNPHISYYDFWNVSYASWTGTSTWSTETIVPRDMSDYVPTRLVIDSNDVPYVAVPSGMLWYKKSGAWDYTGGIGLYSSLALDKAGKPHISSFDSSAKQLVYSSLTAWGTSPNPDTWVSVYLDSPAVVAGMGVQMAYDAFGRPHVAYIDTTHHWLKYATLVNGCWKTMTVNPVGTTSAADTVGLAVDPAGTPHIAYIDVVYLKIMYASWNGQGWSQEIVANDTEGYQGTFERYLSLALDANGQPFISFYDGGSLSLKMAKKVGSAWQVEPVDGTGTKWVGVYNSIAVDGLGRPHISYMSNPNRLWHAFYNGSTWVKVQPDTVSLNSGWNSALAVDSSNRSHICYVDGTDYALHYAHDTGSGWEILTVSSSGPVQPGDPMDTCSIRMGPGNTPYISYYDYISRSLKLAHRSGSGWVTESIDANGDAGAFSALAFFNAVPRIAYFHNGNLDLQYIQWGG